MVLCGEDQDFTRRVLTAYAQLALGSFSAGYDTLNPPDWDSISYRNDLRGPYVSQKDPLSSMGCSPWCHSGSAPLPAQSEGEGVDVSTKDMDVTEEAEPIDTKPGDASASSIASSQIVIAEVDRIVDHRVDDAGNWSFLVKWANSSLKAATWEPLDHLEECAYKLRDYWTKVSPSTNLRRAKVTRVITEEEVALGKIKIHKMISAMDASMDASEGNAKKCVEHALKALLDIKQIVTTHFLQTGRNLHNLLRLFQYLGHPVTRVRKGTAAAPNIAIANAIARPSDVIRSLGPGKYLCMNKRHCFAVAIRPAETGNPVSIYDCSFKTMHDFKKLDKMLEHYGCVQRIWKIGPTKLRNRTARQRKIIELVKEKAAATATAVATATVTRP